MAHGDAREAKWRGIWQMEWVASTLTPTQNMVYPALLPLMRTPRLPAVDLNWRSRRFKWTRPFRRKTKSGFCACAITFQTRYTSGKTHSFQITKTSRIKLYREIAAVTCENDKNHMNAVCDEKVGASLLKSRDIGLCSGYHRALKTSANYTILNTFHIRCINL